MSTSVSNVVNHFPSAENAFTTTTSGSVPSGATSVGLNSLAGYVTGEVAVFVIDPTDSDKKQVFTGVVDTAGPQVTSVVWTEGNNQNHSAGATVVDYATATHISMMSKGTLVHADQDGTLKAGSVDVAAVLADNVVTTTKILNDNVTDPKVADGFAIQQVDALYSAVATGTTVIPYDDTIPQNTEGNEYMTVSITPKDVTNKLVIESVIHISNSATNQRLISALFQDSTASALAVGTTSEITANVSNPVYVYHSMTANTTSAIAFKIRAGANGAGTTTFNGDSGARKFGGITHSFIKVTEYKA